MVMWRVKRVVLCLPYDCCLLEVGNPCFMALERGAGRTLHSDRPSSRSSVSAQIELEVVIVQRPSHV